MRKYIAAVLAAVMLMGILAGCSAEMFMSSEDLIAKGDEALANNDLTEALNYYKQAGPEGDEKEKEVLGRKVMVILSKRNMMTGSNGYVYILEDALEFLEDEAEYTFSEEERYAFLLECAKQKMEGFYEERSHSDAGKFLSALSKKIPADTPGLEEFVNEAYFKLGYDSLVYDVTEAEYSTSVLHDALWQWQNCTAGPGYECYNALEKLIPQKKYQEGFSVLAQYIPEVEILDAICSELKGNLTFNTASELFAFDAAYYEMSPRTDSALSLTESYFNMEDVRLGNDYGFDTTILSLSELEGSCGKSPDGRILFLHKPNDYDDTVGLYLPLMNLLPNDYYPNSLESVEYVVWVECDSVMTGATFTGGTEEMREDVTIRVYDTKTGEVLHEAFHEGPTHFTFSYYGDEPPAVYSAGAPTINSDILEAVAAIESYRNQ